MKALEAVLWARSPSQKYLRVVWLSTPPFPQASVLKDLDYDFLHEMWQR